MRGLVMAGMLGWVFFAFGFSCTGALGWAIAAVVSFMVAVFAFLALVASPKRRR